LVDTLSYRGFWRFLERYSSSCWEEFKQSLSKTLFVGALQRLVPEIQISDLEQGGAGVRAQALSPQGELIQDFSFIRQPRALHVLNAPSPAATASLSIADAVIDMAQEALLR
jgi:L-2-hydroxyglutarate oxidase LhgO